MQRQYKSGVAKRTLRVEQEKRDEQIKKKMPCLLRYGFETSLISNIKRKNHHWMKIRLSVVKLTKPK